MNFRKIIFFFIVFIISQFCRIQILQAQTATIRGFVYEEASGEPALFTNVYLHHTTYGSSTDLNGYFVISKIPPGEYTLIVTYLGFDTLQIPVSLKKNDLITKKFYLKKSVVNLSEINIIAAKSQERKLETQTSLIKITPKEIRQIPMIGGQPDLAQYLQVLPGVIFTGDQGGQMYIRGGSPIQNKVLLDGMTIYNPFHSIGFFSVYDMDLVRNTDVYTGGFGAEYGGRISSIMDIKTRDGNKKRISGKLDASTFGAKVMIEGPLVKQKEDGKGSASFILSFKNSYLKETSKTLYTYANSDGLPFNYNDLYGKISLNASNGSKVNLFGFNFTDQVKYRALQNYHWNSSGGGVNFLAIPGNSAVLIDGIFAYSTYKVTLEEVSRSPRSSLINSFNVNLNFSYFFAKNELKYGLELQGGKTVFDFFNSINRKIDYTQNTSEIGGYVKYKWNLGRLILEPGLRIQYYASLSEVSIEPRLSAKYNLSDKVSLKMAAGLYSQNLISANYDRDVVNFFYGFLSGPDNLQKQFYGKAVTSKLQKSQHLILGLEWQVTDKLFMNLEGYYKYFPQLTNLNRDKVFDEPDDASNPYTYPDHLTKDFIVEKGDAEGADVSIKYEASRFNFWAVYSLGYIHRHDGFHDYVPHYDRRHNVNLMTSYTLGRKRNWQVDARWNLGSGFPFTQTQGEFELLTFNNGINTNYTTANGELGVLYSEINTGRLPYYHRLDLSIHKKWEFGKNIKLEADLSVTNVYNRKNIFYFDRITNQRVNQLPILPSIGLSFSF